MDPGRTAVPGEKSMNEVVLIVEDEVASAEILADYLRREG